MAKAKKPKVKVKDKKSVKKIIKSVKQKKFLVKKQIKKIVAKKPKSDKPTKKVLVKQIVDKKNPVKKVLIKKNTKPKKKVVTKKKPVVKKQQKSNSVKIIKTKKTVKTTKIVKISEKDIKPKIKRISKKKVKKNIQKPQITEFPSEALFKARIKVIGIGGGGGSIVSEIGRSLEKATFVVADTDIRALKKKSGIKYLWFGEEFTHGLGTGVNVDLARQAAHSAKEKLSGIFKDQDIIIFIASLGGGLGSGATQIFADVAKEFGGITFGIFTTPFKFEGKNKQRIAQTALKSLRQSLNVSLVIPNEKIFKIIDANTALTDAFSIVNKSLIESLESLIDLIYNPGIINIDFADLRTILRGIGNTAFLNTVEESGKDRAEKICQKVLVNPLLQNTSFEAEKILFNIAGSENLSMFEVEKISSYIANLNPKAKIIFGISKSAKLKNRIKTTILMTGGAVKESILDKKVISKLEPIGFIEEKKIAEDLGIKEEKEERKKTIVKKSKTQTPKVEKKKVKSEKLDKKPKKQKTTKKSAPKTKGKSKRKSESDAGQKGNSEQNPVSFIPVFETSAPSVPIINQNRINIIETIPVPSKKTIRRSGLEIKKAEELQEKKRIDQEKEWEIPAFLRKVKFKN